MTQPIKRVRKALIPAAGLGTRFLPATKVIPKEMLPIVDKPGIQYVVEECLASRIENVIIVTGLGKTAVEDHFDYAPALEHFLETRGKKDLAELSHAIGDMARFTYTRQKEPLGLGHAVLAARELVGDEPFAVLLPDVIIPGANPATRQIIDIYEETGIATIAVEAVPKDKIHLYGVVDGQAESHARWKSGLLRVRDLVEKPTADKAPSNLAVTGRYILPPEIFGYIEKVTPGAGGEIQLTDALRMLAREKGLYAYSFEGQSYDAGDKLGFLKATVELALQNRALGPEFRAYLRSLKL